MALYSQKLQEIEFYTDSLLSSPKNTQVHVILYRNETRSTKPRNMCMSQTIKDVKIAKKRFNTFIQTDKPVYKPGDVVKFRIIVVDNSLLPYHPQNLQINIIDSKGQSIKEINEFDGNFDAVYSKIFVLSNDTSLGVWKISVVVDKHQQWPTSKRFGVTKLNLPKFTAHIKLRYHQVLINSDLHFSIYAHNIDSDFVRGDAQLTISCTSNNQVVMTENFTDIAAIHNVKFKVHEDLKANTTTKLYYEATIIFTEAESGLTANKAIKFTVHSDSRPKIKVNHPEKFIPGQPFSVKAFIYNWMEELIQSSIERVKISLNCVLKSGKQKSILADGAIKKGLAIYSFVIPESAEELTVQVRFLHVTYEGIATMDAAAMGFNKIAVDYLPKL